MKKIFILILLFVLVMPVFGQGTAHVKVVAYYFHGNVRCVTCHKLEKYSKEAIEQNFKEALSSGKLEFKAINVDEKANEHFVDDYQLYTKSLILVLMKDGKQIKYKNLDKIWEYVGDKKKFFGYVTKETRDFLRDS
jgi:hypothetical protein